jgi:serine/threonine protein kinase
VVYLVAEERETLLMRLGDDRHLGYGDPDMMIGTPVGPFTIVRLVSEGETGKVYVAEHAVLKAQRTVKLLSPQLSENALLRQRFLNEARAVAKLHHRNLIQIHDVGQLPNGPWFVMLDYLDGETLDGYMATHTGPIPVHTTLRIVCEIANGLHAAHEHEIIHRDLRPENVFLIDRDGAPYPAVVLDFSIARLSDDPAAGARSGAASGVLAYLAPEQLCGTRVGPAADIAADIFALGVIAYEMTTGGWFPYQHDETRAGYVEMGAAELYHRQMTRPPVAPRERVAGLGNAWSDAILAAINPDPAERPASVHAFLLRLAAAVAPEGLAPGGPAIVWAHARELSDAGEGKAIGALPSFTAAGSRYQLGDKLGNGGMAEVFAGTMLGVEGFARKVAIKRVLAGLSQVPTFASMFVTEAQIVSQLAHPNIVSVLDFSRDLEDRLFLVMEYVDGKDLASLLHAGSIPPSLAIFIVIEMLRGLGYAHDLPDPTTGTRGVIHRDVSPQNLLLGYEGAVKVSDFGLAKARAASEGVWSETVRGKPSYMAPEQVSGEMLDGRTDLYAVGVMLWEMLAHRPLFTGTSKEIMAQVMFKGIATPSELRGGVPADLETVTMKLLARDRDARYPTAEAAIEALLQCGDVPRDGRGELMRLLAARFPKAGSSSRGKATAAPGVPHTLRIERGTVPDPLSVVANPIPSIGAICIVRRPRRWLFAAALSAAVCGGLAVAAVIACGKATPPGVMDPVVLPSRVSASVAMSTVPAVPAVATTSPTSAASAPSVASTIRVPKSAPAPRPTMRPSSGSLGRLSPPVTGTGELAIIVKPWAVVWLNGKRSGQTPFREAVPAGRYLVRLANDDVGQDETTTITVAPDKMATVERNW